MRNGARILAVIGFLQLPACIIPQSLTAIYPDVHFRADCTCLACTAGYDPVSQKCRDDPVSDTIPFLKCEAQDREAAAEASLTAECNARTRTVGLQACALDEIDPGDATGSRYVLPAVDAPACPEIAALTGIGQISGVHGGSLVELDEAVSRVEVFSGHSQASFLVRGDIGFSGANCFDRSCPVTLNWISMMSTGDIVFHTVGREDIPASLAYAFNGRAVKGTFAAAPGTTAETRYGGLSFPAGSIDLLLSATANNDRHGISFTNHESVGVGRIGSDRTFELQTVATAEETRIHLDLKGRITRFAPFVKLTKVLQERHILLGALFGRSRVQLSAEVYDFDKSEGVARTWLLDNRPVAAAGEFTKTLGPGTHSVTLLVSDTDGARSSDTMEIVVEEGSLTPWLPWLPWILLVAIMVLILWLAGVWRR